MKFCFRIMVAIPLALALSACDSLGQKSADPVSPTVTPGQPSKSADAAPKTVPAPHPDGAKKVAETGEEQKNHGDSIYFASGKTAVDEQGQQLLRQHAALLKESPRLIVTLVAYTDQQGSRSYNLARAEQRMKAVAEALRALGVPSKQIRTESAGHSKNNGPCSTAACRQQGWRVDLIYRK